MRAISPDNQTFISPIGGLWVRGRGGISYRVINHTQRCDPPRLVLFDDSPDEAYGSEVWEQMPAAWSSDGYLRLWPAKQTLVPQRSQKKFIPRAQVVWC